VNTKRTPKHRTPKKIQLRVQINSSETRRLRRSAQSYAKRVEASLSTPPYVPLNAWSELTLPAVFDETLAHELVQVSIFHSIEAAYTPLPGSTRLVIQQEIEQAQKLTEIPLHAWTELAV
jgi:hypothetical protein